MVSSTDSAIPLPSSKLDLIVDAAKPPATPGVPKVFNKPPNNFLVLDLTDLFNNGAAAIGAT